MKQNVDEKGNRWWQVTYWIVFAIICVCLFVRCRYSLSASLSDEFSQPATVNRFLHGDVPILDNWTASTMFSGFVMSFFYWLFGIGMMPVLTARYMYIVYQIVIAAAIFLLMPKRNVAVMAASLVYLCSTPYNINRITYNTLSIGLFILFCVLFYGIKEQDDKKMGNRLRIVISGIVFSQVVLAIPHNALLYFIYLAVVIVGALLGKNDGKEGIKELFSIERLFLVAFGIVIAAVPFIVYFLVKGPVSGYFANLEYILSDAEYSKSIVVKLFESQYRIARVYWRVWLPLVLLDVVSLVFLRRRSNAYRIIYSISNLVVIYGVIRFAFIYGSVSINLAVPPVFFLGLQAAILTHIFDKDISGTQCNYALVTWLIAGYIFYICEYLATDTEILSSSASLIVAAIPALLLDFECAYSSKHIEPLITACVCIVCFFILRMTFVWGDAPLFELDTKIVEGTARGIYTTQESAAAYQRAEKIIKQADIEAEDQVLVLPMNPTYYYLIDAGCASPYIFRFEVSLDELDNYYNLHPEKLPTVVVTCKNDDSGNEYDIDECLEYFENMTDMGYYVYYNSDDAIVLKR